MKITTVIPTRNRPNHVRKVLATLQAQTRQADEIIIVDSSDEIKYLEVIKESFAGLPLKYISSEASVCIQRNIGIAQATGDWVFLCDDDIELSKDYLEKLELYTTLHPECGAIAGRLLQQEDDKWVDQYPVTGARDLIWRFIFQLSVWGDLQNIKSSFSPVNLLLVYIKKFYSRRGNGFTLAGWPIITSWSASFQTTIYSLGADLIRRDWLLQSPYDEVLDPSGIGDNYGVAIGFPQDRGIHVIDSTVAYHHRANENRLDRTLAYYRRVLALHYFIKKSKRFTKVTALFFLWSLTGNTLLYLAKGSKNMIRANLKIIALILTNKNPYWVAFRKNKKVTKPNFI
jgi:glycosyltransferase involved in cell wall biosynthesis